MVIVVWSTSVGVVLGQQIEAVTFDNKSEPPLGADGAIEVIGKGAKAMLFPSDFDFGAPGAFVAQQNGVLSFSGASDPKWGGEGQNKPAGQLSGGEQQMLVIARGTLSDPVLLMLDEPSLGLAPMITDQVYAMIETVRQCGALSCAW